MIIVVAGVSGSGKTTIGQRLALEKKLPFYDADDFHSEANLAKLATGIALTDDDRRPWLENLAKKIKEWNKQEGAVLACSALKESYRRILQTDLDEPINWVVLNASMEVIAERLAQRKDHFFNPVLLQSQFDTLELPTYGILVDVSQSEDFVVKQIIEQLDSSFHMGLIGLGVMGKSLALNIAEKGFDLAVFNRHVEAKEVDVAKSFVAKNPDFPLQGFDDLESFVRSIAQPRNILLMVNAGNPVDQVINDLIPKLDKGDAIIDCGNSHYLETARRLASCKKEGIRFLGVGVSGGEEGARKGPSIMPGGDMEVYNRIKPVLQKIAARDNKNTPCVSFVGLAGAGHFVKMIHNGIEYAEMQLIAEVYQFLRFHQNKSPEQIADIFDSWNNSKLRSYLLEISADILKRKEGTEYLIDKILDKSTNKGTGGWTTEAAIRHGQPASTISEALAARFISTQKNVRHQVSLKYTGSASNTELDLETLRKAYEVARIINHIIGLELIKEGSNNNQWAIDTSELARTWTNGCIIRSTLIDELSELNLDAQNLLLEPSIVDRIDEAVESLKLFTTRALLSNCAVPVFSAALNFLLQMQTDVLPATLIQAQRDYFGAHTYALNDDPEGVYHTEWTKGLEH